MAEFRSSHRSNGGNRNLDMVFNENKGGQAYKSRSRCPEPPSARSRASKQAERIQSSSLKTWNLNDSELKRRKRVAKYKIYAVEGKVKASLGKGVRWIRNKYSEIVHGY